MEIRQKVMGYANSNTYYIIDDNEVIIIDPCLDPHNDSRRLLKEIGQRNVIAVLITHGHFDHISGIDAIIDIYQCPVYVPRDEVGWLSDPNLNLSTMTPDTVLIKSKITPIDLGELNVGNHVFEILHTPGHTQASISYKLNEHIFDGDFIFNQSIGRTDLPTGNSKVMYRAILDFIEKYEKEGIKLYPGHGPITTLNQEIKINPWILQLQKR